jgi:hypothetical protein
VEPTPARCNPDASIAPTREKDWHPTSHPERIISGMRASVNNSPPRWPFWLLIVAWVCANSPQAATYAVLAWIAEARQFTHQQQLTRDVAHLLVGEKAPTHQAVVATSDEGRASEWPRSQVPAGAVLKKIDLSTEKRMEHVRPIAARRSFERTTNWRTDALRAPPLHGPPRADAVT